MAAASSEGGHPQHKYWERRILYAYLRMMGMSQIDAGRAVGRTERVVQSWEYAASWPPGAGRGTPTLVGGPHGCQPQDAPGQYSSRGGDLALKVLEAGPRPRPTGPTAPAPA